jgi:hypothetical protein
MYEIMRANGVDESEQPSLPADADMSHQKMFSFERDCSSQRSGTTSSCRSDHQQLQRDTPAAAEGPPSMQKDHQQLQNEREVEARKRRMMFTERSRTFCTNLLRLPQRFRDASYTAMDIESGVCLQDLPLVITQRIIGRLLLAYDRCPKPDGRLGDDKVKMMHATLYKMCNF